MRFYNYKLLSLIIIFFVIIFSLMCEKKNNEKTLEEYRMDLLSNDKNKIIIACYFLGEGKDKNSIPFLIKDLNDPRITHNIKYLGMSVYYAKIGALQKITGIKYGNVTSSSKPDTEIIAKWENWWYKNRDEYLK